MAVFGPTVILITFIVVQFALWVHAKNVAQSAAEAGARAARAYKATDADGRKAATDMFSQLDGQSVTSGALRVTPTRTVSDVSVVIQTHSVALIPGVEFPVNVSAGGPIEQFVAP